MKCVLRFGAGRMECGNPGPAWSSVAHAQAAVHRQHRAGDVAGCIRAEEQRRAAELEYRIAELSGALKSLVDQSQGSQIQLVSTLDERLTDQAERTGQSLKQLHERLAVIDAAQKNIAALSSEMLSLKDILSNKQARGAYGQARMEAIIRDGLPSSAYAFQGSLSNNTRPDCLVSLPDSDIRLVIDAKFPLEAFNALKLARGEAEIKAANEAAAARRPKPLAG
mgnify:CR=1 FL=1